MVFFGSSKRSPSWTPGSFPAGPMQVVGYSSYSPSAVWQPQPVMMAAYPPSPMFVQVPVPVPVEVPVQVQVPVHVPVHTPVAAPPAPFTPGTTFTVVQHTPATNTLHLEMVPSPRITHSIPPAPPVHPAPYRSPRPPAPQPLPQDQWSQAQQVQIYPSQQQQQGSSPITINVFATPQQAQTPLAPGSTPGPGFAPVLPPTTPAPPVTDDNDVSDGDDSTVHDNTHRNHDIQQPIPIRSSNTLISISCSPHLGLSALNTSTPLPPTPYRR